MPRETAQVDPLIGLLRRHGVTIEMGDPVSECPPGWVSIVDDLLRELAQTGCRTVDQVKQKMGELCVYLPESASDVAREAVDKAAARAARTCEDCGIPGERRDDLRWVQTLCAACWQKKMAPSPPRHVR